jgi:outer membrane protein
VPVSFRKVLMGTLAASLLAVPAMAEVKIGVIDYARLLEESQQVQDALRSEFGPRYQQLLAQENSLKSRGEKLQKDAATMSPDQRTKAEKELRDGARDLERKKQEWQDDSNAKRNDEMNKLQRSLIGEVRDYAKAQNFDIVIAEGVIFATPAVDITPAVLQSLLSRAPKPAAAPAGAPAPAKPAPKP